MRFNRRKLLKSIGTAGIGLAGLSGTASGVDDSVRTLKGTIDSPITIQEVKELQDRFTKKVDSPNINPTSFGLVKDPTYEDKELIGYGIKYDSETRSPTEIIRTVPNPDSIGDSSPSGYTNGMGKNDGRRVEKTELRKEISKKMNGGKGIGLEKAVEQSHGEIDNFGGKNSRGI